MASTLARVFLEWWRAPSARSFHVLVEGTGFELSLGYRGRMQRFSAWRRVWAESETEARIAARLQVAREWAAQGWPEIAGQPVLSTPLVSRLSRISLWAAKDTPFEFAPQA